MTYSSEHPHPHSWADVPPPGPVTGAPHRRPRRSRPAVAAVLVAGTTAASVAVGHYLWPSPTSRASALASEPAGSAPAGSGALPSTVPQAGGASSGSVPDVSSVAAKVDPALVDINTAFGYQSASGAGTGIVLSSNGVVLTNNHVINGATSISVTDLGNGRTYKAVVVGYDKTADVAVLKLQNASGLHTARLADSSTTRVGQAVVAIGNAGGRGGTPSTAPGAVTALGQDITASDSLTGTSEQLTGLIQVNAHVQPGDSGGPLVDSSGQVIGMDTAASSTYSLQSQASAGFAIPIDTALSVAHQIQAGRSSSTVHVGPTAFLGVTISAGNTVPSGGSPDPGGFSSGGGGYGYGAGGEGYGGYGSAYGGSGYGYASPGSAGPGTSTTGGATVSGVVPGGAAARAGLAAGDTITAVNGQAVSSPSDLSTVIAGDRPGDRIQLAWTDPAGQSHTTTVDLGSGPPA